MVTPSNGFILIKPLSDDFFAIPEQKGIVRTGEVLEVGDIIYHASGKELKGTCVKGDKVVFTYYEDEDFSIDGKAHYIVPFTRIIAKYDSSK